MPAAPTFSPACSTFSPACTMKWAAASAALRATPRRLDAPSPLTSCFSITSSISGSTDPARPTDPARIVPAAPHVLAHRDPVAAGVDLTPVVAQFGLEGAVPLDVVRVVAGGAEAVAQRALAVQSPRQRALRALPASRVLIVPPARGGLALQRQHLVVHDSFSILG